LCGSVWPTTNWSGVTTPTFPLMMDWRHDTILEVWKNVWSGGWNYHLRTPNWEKTRDRLYL